MEMYLNIANNTMKSRDEWIRTLPKQLLSEGETWDSLVQEVLALGVFVEIHDFDDHPTHTLQCVPISSETITAAPLEGGFNG